MGAKQQHSSYFPADVIKHCGQGDLQKKLFIWVSQGQKSVLGGGAGMTAEAEAKGSHLAPLARIRESNGQTKLNRNKKYAVSI